MRYIWTANNAAFDTMELQADRQETESRGITRILTGSGNSFTPPTPDTTPCTTEVPSPRADERSTAQVLDRVAADLVKQLDKDSARHAPVHGAVSPPHHTDSTPHKHS